MSKYKIATYPQDKYRFELYDNVERLTWQEIRKRTGCFALVNLWYFSFATFGHECAVMLRGRWAREPGYDWPGICITPDGRVSTGGTVDAAWDYASSVQADYIAGKRTNTTAWGRNGVTYTGVKGDGSVVCLLAPKDTGLTGGEAVAAMLGAGCVDVLRWDGSWSSQGSLGPGLDVQPSQKRICRGWLLVFPRDDKKEEDKPMSKKVCLDPGHGPGCVNGSPDGSYKEHEFAWDMAERIKAHLERCGVTVVMTRDGAGYPSLAERCNISNRAGVDLFVSLHSNASGDGKGWTSPSGYLIYTSAGPETAARNVAARAVLKRAREAGVSIRGGGLEHDLEYAVLKGTTAPAMIIEHGFHTNREDTALLKTDAYRAKLAEADARGILDFLGLSWVAEKPAGTTDTPAADWAAEAWRKARDKGVMDGTRPADCVTRQELAVVLDRLGLLN